MVIKLDSFVYDECYMSLWLFNSAYCLHGVTVVPDSNKVKKESLTWKEIPNIH